jgi:putative SOS response-associated peptidase YedK
MCGRYTLRRIDTRRLGVELTPGFEEFTERPRFNVAPSQSMPIVRMIGDHRELALAKWGFVPWWAKEQAKLKPINAKCETAASGRMFREAFTRRRCLIPADGFYEWKGSKPPKQPYFIHMKDDSSFAFAGLWERWKPPDGRGAVDTFTILTTAPNELTAPIHNRMPFILQERDYERWLSGDAPTDLLKPYDAAAMEAFPVGVKVNTPKNDSPDLVGRINQ